jgi:hypothetical protein
MAAKTDDIVDTNKYISVPNLIVGRITLMKTRMDVVMAKKQMVEEEKAAKEKEAEQLQKKYPNASGTSDNICMDGNDPDNQCISIAT